MSINWHDYNSVDAFIAFVLLASMLAGVIRGLVREVLSLIAWVVATLVAYGFGPRLAVLLASWVGEPALRLTFAMAILFVATLLVGALLSHVAHELVEDAGLEPVDRLLGSLFGLARGVVVMIVLTIYLPTAAKQSEAWRHSRLAPQFVAWEQASRHLVEKAGDAVHRLSG